MLLRGLLRFGSHSRKCRIPFQQLRFCSSSTGIYEAKEISIPVHWGEVRGRLWEEPSSGPKKTIFGIHGWLDNAGTMNGIAPHLPPGYRFYSFDQPGCGLSSPCADAWGYNHMHILVWLKHLKETLGLKEEKISIIAFSLGSFFSQLYACTFPDEVDKLVLMDLIHATIHPTEHFFLSLNMYTRGALKLNRIIQSDKKPPEYTYEEALRIYLKSFTEMNGPNALTEKSVETLMERGMEKTPSGKYKWRHDPRMVNPPPNTVTQDMVDLMAISLKNPILLIKASDSSYYSEPEDAERYLSLQREHNPLFQYVEVEGGHYAHLNYPERLIPHIRKFLSD